MGENDRIRLQARRRFLTSTALGGLGLIAGAKTARAWSEQPMNAETHKLYANRCQLASDGYHEQLAAAERTRLAGTMSAADIEKVLATLRCPICGCAIVASAPLAASGDAKSG